MKLSDLPKIDFATADPQQMAIEVVSTVEKLLGRTLERADPLRIFLRGVEAIIILQRLLIDQTAKQNLLAYATGDFLDHLGALVGCERLGTSAAVTTVELTLSTARQVTTTITAGTRITAGDDVYFALEDDVIFLAGETVKTAKANCTVAGEVGNGYAAGELTRIVDPQPFLQSVTNVTTSEGGADIESDDAYRERIHAAPEAFSCAGSEGAYIYHTKSVSSLITDVAVYSNPDIAGIVRIYPLLKGGEIPGAEMLEAVAEYLSDKTIRPLTDKVEVLPPTVVEYDIQATYWIAQSDSTNAAIIQSKAETAIQDYITWQAEKLGRDINPSEFIYQLKKAGVKRVAITEPNFLVTNKFSLAKARTVAVTFAGLEED